jgi:hypothetical protein
MESIELGIASLASTLISVRVNVLIALWNVWIHSRKAEATHLYRAKIVLQVHEGSPQRVGRHMSNGGVADMCRIDEQYIHCERTKTRLLNKRNALEPKTEDFSMHY